MTESTRMQPVVTIALDVGDRKTHLAEFHGRAVARTSSLPTSRQAVTREFGSRGPVRVVMEVGSQSPWMSELLRSFGHEVQVVDARRTAKLMRDGHKTDGRDRVTLGMLAVGVPELLGDIKHRPPEAYADIAVLRARDQMVRARTSFIQAIRGMLKTQAIRLPSFSAPAFAKKALPLVPESFRPALEPLFKLLRDLEVEIRRYDVLLEQIAIARYPVTSRLRKVNGVGPLTSLAYVLSVFDPQRFRKSRAVGAWVGLCPKKKQSGDSDPQLSITREGNPYLRRLLVSSAQYIVGPFGKDSMLRRFGLQLCQRGGKNAKKRAVVAVARKLAVLLHRLWISDQPYDPLRGARTA